MGGIALAWIGVGEGQVAQHRHFILNLLHLLGDQPPSMMVCPSQTMAVVVA
jgi:hypothetical protein